MPASGCDPAYIPHISRYNVLSMAGAPVLDLSGLKCPLPVLRTRKKLRGMAPGEKLLVVCTDPMSAIDIPHLLRENGDILEKQDAAGGILRFWLCRGGA